MKKADVCRCGLHDTADEKKMLWVSYNYLCLEASFRLDVSSLLYFKIDMYFDNDRHMNYRTYIKVKQNRTQP